MLEVMGREHRTGFLVLLTFQLCDWVDNFAFLNVNFPKCKMYIINSVLPYPSYTVIGKIK